MKFLNWKCSLVVIAFAMLVACSNDNSDFWPKETQDEMQINGLDVIVWTMGLGNELTGEVADLRYGSINDGIAEVYLWKDFSELEEWFDYLLYGAKARKHETANGKEWDLLDAADRLEGQMTLNRVNDDEGSGEYANLSIVTEKVIGIPKTYRFYKEKDDYSDSPFHFGDAVVVNITKNYYDGTSTEPRHESASDSETFGPGRYQYICVRPAAAGVRGVLLRATQTRYLCQSHYDVTWIDFIMGTGIGEFAARDIHNLVTNKRDELQDCYNKIAHEGDFAPTLSVVNHGGSEIGDDDDFNKSGDWYWTNCEMGTPFFTKNYAVAFKPGRTFVEQFTWLAHSRRRYLPIMQILYFDTDGKIIDQKGLSGEKYFTDVKKQ